tara:strand:+ start:646 stop:1320 length:675 start_codon:yes stop_codon:yes gene_type:complete
MSNFVLIIGMHRSGTSMLSGIVGMSGLYCAGHGKLTKAPIHRTQHLEDRKCMRINNAVLGKSGGSWKSVPDYDEIKNIKDRNLIKTAKEYLRNLQKQAHPNKFSLKDPRFSILSQWWFENLPDLFNPKVIWIERDIDGVVGSLKMREPWARKNPKHAHKVAITYISYIEKMLKEYNPEYIKLKYEEVLKNPMENYKKICNFIEVDPKQNKSLVMDWIRPHFKRN